MPEFEQVSTTSTTTTQPTSVIVQQPLAMQPSTQAAALQVNDVDFGPAYITFILFLLLDQLLLNVLIVIMLVQQK